MMNQQVMFGRLFRAAVFGLCAYIAAIVMVFLRGTVLALPLTCIASVGFVFAGLAAGACNSRFGRTMGLGLLFCAVGDILGRFDFSLGALCFLIAHGAFISAYIVNQAYKRIVYSYACILLMFVLLIILYLFPYVSLSDWFLVLPYITCITMMAVLAPSALEKGTGRILLGSGAFLFLLSDVFVARWRYVAPGPENAFFCYPLYYLACILLALSIAFNQPAPVSSSA